MVTKKPQQIVEVFFKLQFYILLATTVTSGNNIE